MSLQKCTILIATFLINPIFSNLSFSKNENSTLELPLNPLTAKCHQAGRTSANNSDSPTDSGKNCLEEKENSDSKVKSNSKTNAKQSKTEVEATEGNQCPPFCD
jgi:hypothetical protein